MKKCQRCGSDRILSGGGKSSDCNGFQFRGREDDGYVPRDVGIGGGDYYEIELCLECGQMQGEWPQRDPSFSLIVHDEIWFYVGRYSTARRMLEEVYSDFGVWEHSSEPAGVTPDDADVIVKGEPEKVQEFKEWLQRSGLYGLQIEGRPV